MGLNRRDPGAGQSWRWSDGLGVSGPGGGGQQVGGARGELVGWAWSLREGQSLAVGEV